MSHTKKNLVGAITVTGEAGAARPWEYVLEYPATGGIA